MDVNRDGLAELEGTSFSDLTVALGGRGRARSVWTLLRAGEDPFTRADVSAPVRERLERGFRRGSLDLKSSTRAECGTTKFLFRLHDGRMVETVLIPSERRSTVCLSTQVGCARGCSFCVTATMGLVRQLSTGEIVAQLVAAIRLSQAQGLPPVRNVVYMGMGEPLDNLSHVRASVSLLCDDLCLGFAPSHVTLSTVGPSPQLIVASRDIKARMAWSLHAVDEALRKTLIPTAQHSPEELRAAFLKRFESSSSTGQSLFIEVTLMDSVNDSVDQAKSMASFLKPFPTGIRVNLLPMNSGRQGLAPSPKARVQAFRQVLRDSGYFCDIRTVRGAAKNAACGQLATV